MKVNVNNKIHEVDSTCYLTELLQSLLGDAIQGIGVAVNDNLIPRSQHASYKLQENDRILLIKAAQGG